MTERLATKVITPKFRASYAHVWEKKETPSGTMKYSLSMVFDKNTNLDKIKKAAKNAATNKWGVDTAKWPKNLRWPWRDGDAEREESDVYQNSIFINASSNNKPGILDESKNEMFDEDGFYSGCYAIASVNFFAYDKAGNRGVGCGLNNIMKVSDGERLDGQSSANSDFKDVEAVSQETVVGDDIPF